LIRNRLPKQGRSNRGRKQNQRQCKPLPAGQRVGPASTVKNDRPRPLKRTDSSPSGKQRPGGKHGNQKNNDHFVAHRRRDYTTSYTETLKVSSALQWKIPSTHGFPKNQRLHFSEKPFGSAAFYG
jgi:hypothetical protein